jgi:hypothetical protein
MVSRAKVAEIESGGSAKEPYDEETKAVIYEGASVRQLAIMFRMDPAVVSRKIAGLIPVGRRRGSTIYSIPEAAARLVKPGYEIERYIMEMNHLDLPPLLAKEFWNAQRSRLAFEEANGDLWRTADVVRGFAEVFQTLRMALLLMADAVERETSLTDGQRLTIRRLIDGALLECRTKLIEKFNEYGDGPDNDLGSATPDQDARGNRVPATEEVEDEYCGL